VVIGVAALQLHSGVLYWQWGSHDTLQFAGISLLVLGKVAKAGTDLYA